MKTPDASLVEVSGYDSGVVQNVHFVSQGTVFIGPVEGRESEMVVNCCVASSEINLDIIVEIYSSCEVR